MIRICGGLAAGIRKEAMVDLQRAEKIAAEAIKWLSPYCQRIEVAGSVRRRKPVVNDLDLVVIPCDRWGLDSALVRLGKYKMSGNKIAWVEMDSISLDIYFATPETWATLLLIRTGSKENNIRLCSLAKKRGWHLSASGDGLFDETGKRIAGDSEESIYEALGLAYQESWERN